VDDAAGRLFGELEESQQMGLSRAATTENELMIRCFATQWQVRLDEYFYQLGGIMLAFGPLVNADHSLSKSLTLEQTG
jgi:hypothetical protein